MTLSVPRAAAHLLTCGESGWISAWWPADSNALDIEGMNHGEVMNGAIFDVPDSMGLRRD